MSKIHQPKVSMQAVHTLPDPGASQGARKATEDAPGSAAPRSMTDIRVANRDRLGHRQPQEGTQPLVKRLHDDLPQIVSRTRSVLRAK